MVTTYQETERISAYDIQQLERIFSSKRDYNIPRRALDVTTPQTTSALTKYQPARVQAKTQRRGTPVDSIGDFKTRKSLQFDPTVRTISESGKVLKDKTELTSTTVGASRLRTSDQMPKNLGFKLAITGNTGGAFLTSTDQNFIIAGIIDGFTLRQTFLESANQYSVRERGGYKFGYGIGETINLGTRQTIQDIQDQKRRISEQIRQIKPPQFEIPRITIPKIRIPDAEEIKIPEIEFPDIPGLEDIKIPFPELKPIPIPRPEPPISRKREEIRKITGTLCGQVVIQYVYARRITGYSNESIEGIGQILTWDNVPWESIVNERLNVIREQGFEYANVWDFLTGGGGVDNGRTVNAGTNTEHQIFQNIGDRWGINGSDYSGGFPYYSVSAGTIVTGKPASGVLDLYDSEDSYGVPRTNRKVQVYDYQVQNDREENCRGIIPEIPPTPEERCCMSCEHEKIDYRKIKLIVKETLAEQRFILNIPIVKCEFNEQTQEWEPKTTDTPYEFFAPSLLIANQQAQLHIENAKQMSELCYARNGVESGEAIAAIPLSWQIRNEGNRPQLVIQCAEKLAGNKYASAVYPITVPHWRGGVNDRPALPAYRKGNYEGIFVLKDNSKVTINAQNEAECMRILNAVKLWIKRDMLEGSYFKGGFIKANIKNTWVKPMYGRYFSTGQKNNKPDWRVDFP